MPTWHTHDGWGGQHVPGVLSAFIATLCYASSYICIRKGQTDSDPGDHGLFPVLIIGGGTLTIALFVKVLKDATPLIMGTNKELAILFCILAGVIGTCFGRMALYTAIARLGATRGVIIDMLSAMVTLAIAIAFMGEKFRWFSIYGIFAIVLGISLLVIERASFSSRYVKRIYRNGVLMGLLAAMLQGVGHVFRKPSAVSPISPTFAATLDIVAALLLYIIVLWVTGRLKRYAYHYATHVNLYFLAAGCLSAAAVLLFFTASAVIPVSRVSMIISTQPVIIALLSRLILSNVERVTWFTFTSSILVTLGVIIISV